MAAQPTLTADRLRTLLDYEPRTGIFRWRVNRGGTARIGSIAGTHDSDGYIQIRIDGVLHLGHRLAWLHITGEYPPSEVDHVFGDRDDNRWSNLRMSDRSGNCQNRRRHNANNKTGFLGVSPRSGKFLAQIYADGRKRWLGLYETPEEAHDAYVQAKRDLHRYNTL